MTIRDKKPLEPIMGLTLYDLVLIRKHFLHINLTSRWKQISNTTLKPILVSTQKIHNTQHKHYLFTPCRSVEEPLWRFPVGDHSRGAVG